VTLRAAARMRWRVLGIGLVLAAAGGSFVHAPAARAGGGDPSEPGAYCGLPEPGELPTCLQPAQARYADLFVALDQGGDLSRATDDVETDLTQTGENAYLALSSLAYAYWRLASTAAAAETVDPEVAATLEEWNELLSEVYHKNPEDLRFRNAVRHAALDLETRTASQGFRPAEGLMGRIDHAQDQLGVRGAVRRVLHRVFEPTPPPESSTGPDSEPGAAEPSEPDRE
jgi:hypothetical protein